MTPDEARAVEALVEDVRRRVAAAARRTLRAIGTALIVAWCRLSRSHVIEPWIHLGVVLDLSAAKRFGSHTGCPSCTWCVECDELLGREEVGPI